MSANIRHPPDKARILQVSLDMRFTTALLALVGTTQAFFFGGSSCGCSAPPACAPPPVPSCGGQRGYAVGPQPLPSFPIPQTSYAQPAPLSLPASYAGPPPSGGYAVGPRRQRQATASMLERFFNGIDQSKSANVRVKRDDEAVFDPKCNSEILKEIINKHMDESTAIAKRQIQTAATEQLGGRIDVVCARGTFSYIVNTELYCETEKNGTTCFAFRQAS